VCLKLRRRYGKTDKRKSIVFRAGIRKLPYFIEVETVRRAVRVAEDKTQPVSECFLKIRNPGQKLR